MQVSPRQVPGSDPALLKSRLGREAFLLGYKVATSHQHATIRIIKQVYLGCA